MSLFPGERPTLPSLQDWDEFGSRAGRFSPPFPPPPRSLLHLKAPILPAPLPTGIHYYKNERGELCSRSYAVSNYSCGDMEDVDGLLRGAKATGEVVYVFAVWAVPNATNLTVRCAFVDDEPAYSSFFKPLPPAELLEFLRKNGGGPDRGRFPHDCPFCQRPAFVGFNQVDCSGGCR
jgi:hypothetical protein